MWGGRGIAVEQPWRYLKRTNRRDERLPIRVGGPALLGQEGHFLRRVENAVPSSLGRRRIRIGLNKAVRICVSSEVGIQRRGTRIGPYRAR
jgi:hypothetical protein